MDVAQLRLIQSDGARVKFLFFWGHTGRPGVVGRECLSQWYPSPFVLDGVRYLTSEHFMMASKARLFGDDSTAERIVRAEHPGEAKRLGRQVRGFDPDVWDVERVPVVVRGNVAKFEQNPGLGSFLRGTGRRVLVEASPVDRVWGIGLGADDAGADDPARWRGLNLLGFALMDVRDRVAG